MILTGLDPRIFRDYLQQYVDQHYGYGFCDRCGGTCREFDCSGLYCHGCNGTGLTRGLCTTSFVIAQQCTDLGLEMTRDEAIADSGPDVFSAFHGADHGRVDDGSRPNGASGHVVIVVRVRDANGHTTGFYTIEAMGRRYGCVNGQFFGRSPGWSGVYRIPGVADRPPAPPVDPKLKARAIELDQWRHRRYGEHVGVGPVGPLKLGDRNPDVLILNRELRNAHYLLRIIPVGNAFGARTRRGNYKLKFAHPALGNTDGTSFGGPAADVLVAMVL